MKKFTGAEDGMGNKLAKIRAQLQELARKGPNQVGAAPAGNETISDDGGVEANKAESIRKDETLVRDALALFGVDYDGLIRLEPKDGETSVYAQAVQANPQLTADVLQAEQPIVAALKVALGFKPFAEFTKKYGNSPEQIKAAMKAELEAENKGQDKVEKPKAQVAPLFSGPTGQARPNATAKKSYALKDVFGR